MLDRLDVSDAEKASVFASSRTRGLILDLACHERSLRELSTASGLSMSHLKYHIDRLLRFGLVKVAREERRAGRPIKRYRAVARSFFVPARLSQGSVGDKLSAELRASLEQARSVSAEEGVLFSYEPEFGPRMHRVTSSSPAAFEIWSVLSLSNDDARALAGELKAILARYEKTRRQGSRVFLAHAAIAKR